MDESEKRRERLKAMRMEADQTTDFENPGLAPSTLANPLIETDSATASPHQYNTLPRFDYYTDPMSAFSGSKRMHSVSQVHYNTPPRPMDHGMIPTPPHHYPAMNSPSPGPIRSPMGATSPSYRPQQNPPSSSAGSSGAFNYSPRPNFSRGRGRSYGNITRPSGSGPSFRRGKSSYYSKEMVDDPWLGLTPVIWKGVGIIDSDKSWMPKSIAMKKLKASSEAPITQISQQSLAEYLAASFDDSVNEAVEDEKDT